jgi:eukaryotic-like serine/threonine-protein kinase
VAGRYALAFLATFFAQSRLRLPVSNDLTQTQQQGDEAWHRAQEASLRLRKAPTEVPGYDVEKCLGEGAFGEVWLATDRNNPGRKVAIKFYTRRSGDWALLAREVEKLNYLATDRYVVQLIDVGWNADPPYYVMEYMESGSLADRLQRGPLPPKVALEMFHDLATGVVNAHNRGVLHCDLKPANVLLGLDGKPRLADFGQSRLSHEQAPALGTLFYMAPEQADLKAVPDTRWDVYALGAVLYCMLTGAPPYRNSSGAAELEQPGSLEDRLARYRKLLQQASGSRQFRRIPGVDRALSDIISSCLAVNPTKRYANVQAVLSALEARALRRARRPLLILGAVGPILLLLLLALVIRSELRMAVTKATKALIDETKDGNSFAAQAVAAKVGVKIERRWKALELEAGHPKFKALVKAAHGQAMGSPAQSALQTKLMQIQEAHRKDAKASSWSVYDADGTLLAHSPEDRQIDKKYVGMQKFWHKSYFNGLGYDLDPQKDKQVPPLNLSYCLSPCFVGHLTEKRMVTFSVPIWENKPTSKDEPRLGVLGMTVDVGDFAEVLREGNHSGKEDFLAVLVDQSGAILEHPGFAFLREHKVPQKDWNFYVPDLAILQNSWDADYQDPLAAKDPAYEGRWLVTSYPVTIDFSTDADDGPNSSDLVEKTGWVVFIQERYSNVIGPVTDLESEMIQRGWWALGIALTLVTGLWAFVILVLNDGGRSRLLGFLRRQAGLKTDTMVASLKASPGTRPSDFQPTNPGVPTVTAPPVGDQGPTGSQP